MNAECPFEATRDDRKSAALAAERFTLSPDARVIGSLAFARELLRSNVTRQAATGIVDAGAADPAFTSVFFLDGEPHKRKRQAVQRFFTPKAISTRYRAVMERSTDALIEGLRARGQARLDQMSFELAVTVAAEIVGLTESDQTAMTRRIQGTLVALRVGSMSRWRRPLGRLRATVSGILLLRDLRPAIRARQAERREDVISHLLDEGYPEKAMVVECLTYAVAGMITTREFIVMAAWHLLGNDALRRRFLAADEAEQTAILEEIMRIDPVVNMVSRRITDDTTTEFGSVASGETVVFDIRAANLDETSVGECPYALDPDRARRVKNAGLPDLSFGDGGHRCPGAQVALTETRVFLDRLLRLPGIRMEREPAPALDRGAERLRAA